MPIAPLVNLTRTIPRPRAFTTSDGFDHSYDSPKISREAHRWGFADASNELLHLLCGEVRLEYAAARAAGRPTGNLIAEYLALCAELRDRPL